MVMVHRATAVRASISMPAIASGQDHRPLLTRAGHGTVPTSLARLGASESHGQALLVHRTARSDTAAPPPGTRGAALRPTSSHPIASRAPNPIHRNMYSPNSVPTRPSPALQCPPTAPPPAAPASSGRRGGCWAAGTCSRPLGSFRVIGKLGRDRLAT
jgi:hypothetical protein